MTATHSILVALIAVELAVGGSFCWQHAARAEPPLPDLSKLDPETADALRLLRDRARSNNPDDWRELAEGYLGNGCYSAAEQCFQRATQLNPTDQQAAYGRGFCLERTGQTTAAISVLKEVAASADPDLTRTCWYQIGRCYLREEKLSDAESAFRQSLDFRPAVYQLCKLFVRTERSIEAIPLIREQLESLPNDLKFLQLMAKAAHETGDKAAVAEMRDREDRGESITELEYGLRFIGMFSAKLGLGSRLARALRLKESGTANQQASALRGALSLIRENNLWNYRSVYIAMAETQLALGNHAEAQALIAEVRQHSQDGPELLDLEGLMLYDQGQPAAAREVWQRAFRMKPSVELCEQLTAVCSDDLEQQHYRAEGLFLMGADHFRRNRVAEALPYFQQAAEQKPGSDKILFYLADAQRVLGNIDAAETTFAKVLEINPDHGRAVLHRNWNAQKRRRDRTSL